MVKNCQKILNGQKWSKWFNMIQNGPTWLKMVPHGKKNCENGEKWSKWQQKKKVKKCPKWSKWSKIVKNGKNGKKWKKMVQHGELW